MFPGEFVLAAELRNIYRYKKIRCLTKVQSTAISYGGGNITVLCTFIIFYGVFTSINITGALHLNSR